jgi:S-layer homology domain
MKVLKSTRYPISALLAAMLLLSTYTPTPSPAYAAQTHDVQQVLENRSKQNIAEKWLLYKPMDMGTNYMSPDRIYEIAPNLTIPFAPGKIKQEYIKDGINAVNFYRYLAGLPDDVTLDWSLEPQVQTAALVNAVNNRMSHDPEKPEGMEQAMFDLGNEGAGSSNLFYNSFTFYDNVRGYMSDSDARNIDRVGHRRWILNPSMSKTMFGMVYNNQSPHSTMYAFDSSRPDESVSYSYVSWPSAGYFPIEMFEPTDAWSVSMNVDRFDHTRTDDIQVTLTRERDQRTWTLDRNDIDPNGQFFQVETSRFGIPFAVIFRPVNLDQLQEDDVFRVRIAGLYEKSGKSTEVTFTTTFFKLSPNMLPREGIRLNLGETLALARREAALTHHHNLSLTSNTESVVRVNADLSITGVGPGYARITFNDYFGSFNRQQIYVTVMEQSPYDQMSSWVYPDYLLAKGKGLVPFNSDHSYHLPIERREFTTLAVRMIAIALQTDLYDDTPSISPFTDTHDPSIVWAYQNGIIKGVSENTFDRFGHLTREQAATIVLNIHTYLQKQAGVALPKAKQAQSPYSDDGAISAWAKESVYRAVALSIMNGTSQDKFDPQAKLTKEQTFIMLHNVYTHFQR